MVVVYSSRISGSETGLPMLMEHIFSFQHEIYWKRHDLKNALKKKRFFRQKSLTHCVVLYTTIWWLATHQLSHFKTRHLWSTKCLSSCLPGRSCAISTLKGGEPYKMQIQFTKSKTTEFWLSRVLCAPNGMCILLQFVQDCALHL